MGTTVAVALVTPGGAILSSVGDSRIYRLRDGRLTQLTQDDSWIAKLQSEGVALTQSEIERHPMRHVLTDVVGDPGGSGAACRGARVRARRHAAVVQRRAARRAAADLIEELLSADGSVSAVTEALVSTAVANGATDNVTAVVLRRSV